MPRGNVRVSITGDADGLNRATLRAQSDLARFGDNGSKAFNKLKAASVAAGAAMGLFAVKLGTDAVKAAIDAERSQAQLQAQLAAMNISWRKHASEIDRVIQKHSLLSGLDDEDLQDAFTNIVRVTGDVDKGLRLTGLAADFARAKHMDVAKAGELVGKVAGGNTGILSRYGITLKDGATATEALATLQQKFGGQAAAYGRTTAGSIDRLRVAWENALETIGKALTPFLREAAERLSRFIRQMQTGRGEGGKFARTMRDLAQAFRDSWPVIRRAAIILKDYSQIVTTLSGSKLPGFIRVTIALANPITRFIALVRLLISVGRTLSRWFDSVSQKGGELAGKVADKLAPAFRVLKDVVNLALAPLRKAYNLMRDIAGLAGKVVGALGDIGGAVNPFGKGRPLEDFIGQFAPFAPFTGSLGGKSTSLDALKRISLSMGLSGGQGPGQGFRPLDDGWHGVGRAFDSSGPAAQMMAFAQLMARTFGTKLLELIYTPLGFSIKNGKRVPPYAQADHFDHVHVALAGGRQGGPAVRALVGEEGPEIVDLPAGATVHPFSRSRRMIAQMAGMIPGFAKGGTVGQFDATSYGPPWGGIQGTGITATGVNLKGSPHLHGIAVDPSRLKLGAKYWVWPNPFGYKGPFKAFDTGGAIKGNRIDFYDWRGRSAQLGWGHKGVTVYSSDPWKGGKGPIQQGKLLTDAGGKKRGRVDRVGGGGQETLNGKPAPPFGNRPSLPGVLKVGQDDEAPVSGGDTALSGGGGGQASDDALNANTAAIQAHTDAINAAREDSARLEYLLNKQSPQILDQMRALISTSMMRTVTLGRQAAGQPGRAATL